MDYKVLLDTVVKALDMIQVVGSTPGVNLIPYVSTIANAAGTIKMGLDVGKNVAAQIAAFQETFENAPTPNQLASLNIKISELRQELHAPLPPREDGEPE